MLLNLGIVLLLPKIPSFTIWLVLLALQNLLQASPLLGNLAALPTPNLISLKGVLLLPAYPWGDAFKRNGITLLLFGKRD